MECQPMEFFHHIMPCDIWQEIIQLIGSMTSSLQLLEDFYAPYESLCLFEPYPTFCWGTFGGSPRRIHFPAPYNPIEMGICPPWADKYIYVYIYFPIHRLGMTPRSMDERPWTRGWFPELHFRWVSGRTSVNSGKSRVRIRIFRLRYASWLRCVDTITMSFFVSFPWWACRDYGAHSKRHLFCLSCFLPYMLLHWWSPAGIPRCNTWILL
jgi:hypothetical protein